MAVTAPAGERYLAAFDAAERAGLAEGPEWLASVRRAAIARFAEVGFPSGREEEWRYTSVAPIVAAGFPPAGGGPAGVAASALAPFALDAAAPRLVFVDGRCARALCRRPSGPAGLRVDSLAETLGRDGEGLAPRFEGAPAEALDGFAALNTAFFADGAFVSIPAGLRAPEPIHLLFVGAAPVLAAPRTVIVAGPGSEATIVEHYVGVTDAGYLTDAVTDVTVGEGATVRRYVLQQEPPSAFHVGTTRVELARGARLAAGTVTLGGRLVRNTVGVRVAADGGARLDGLYVIGGRQHVDNHLTVDHAEPRGESRQLYKGILGGRARAVFNGRILVRRDAQKTDAQQTNKTLLLADGPEAYSKPQLEIFADDVRCTHGAAEGQLAEEALFYLESRGLGAATARALLARGFAAEVVDRIAEEAVRRYVDAAVLARLPEVGA